MTPLERFRMEVIKALRVEQALNWSSSRLPSWAERLPSPPRWMGFMFWIYLIVATKGAILLYAWLIGQMS